jgi:predicted secreted Zn-dependent protease
MSTAILKYLLLTFTVIQQSNLIPWNATRKLSWDDFKASPDPSSGNAALTSSTINIEFGYDDDDLTYNIRCSFDKSRSWVRIRNNDVLTHEQGHFDIAEVYARRLHKAMKEYRFNAKTVSQDVNGIYENMMNLHRQAQTLYDKETDYSRNKVTQEDWLKKITQQLADLKSFANYQTNAGAKK